jgi:hypothetical protein
MLQGTSQDQIPTSPHSAEATAIPVQTVDADQLPREKGFTYEEMTSIIGSLYLDSAHRAKVQDEQFSAVIEEYDKRIMQLKAELQIQQESGDSLSKQVATLNRELELRNAHTKTRDTSPPGDNGDNSLPGGG